MAFQTLSPGTLLSPVPAVMVSCAMPGKRPNVITVAWAGTVCSDPPMLSISVRKERFSHHILLKAVSLWSIWWGESSCRPPITAACAQGAMWISLPIAG